MYDHIREDLRGFVSADIATRISIIQKDVWIDHRASDEIFRIMNNMADIPDRTNAPALLITGEGGTGKTTIISQMRRRVKNSNSLLMIDMAEDLNLGVKKNLKIELANALGLPANWRSGAQNGDLPSEIKEVIKLRKLWGVAIDEMHDALLRPKQEQRANLSILKRLLGPEYGLVLFCFGTGKARQALRSSFEFERRFYEVKLDDWTEDEKFRSFLLEYEESLPLKEPSNLYSKKMLDTILRLTGGRMDKTIDLIKAAACYAIKNGEEAISAEWLNRASKSPWSY
ncbi:TniB family NTP-binding protein [Pseudomonas chlororaphis]|uniref:TniB family NTP-binding protein n=1 Tax=Pseudomonas chlororaphis TaxID=587753 RepID=UPI00026E4A75|nr:TniB family NTP-binding protein [Pseudomonas chlororaphis]EJL06831.1 TniB family protein [Pseudomonas chlororaphis subsp. aureofaciens 30-84]